MEYYVKILVLNVFGAVEGLSFRSFREFGNIGELTAIWVVSG